MHFESRHITVTSDHGTATLRFGFAGEPTNALNLSHLREFEKALDAVASHRAITILVVRSAIPSGFCEGLCPSAVLSLLHPTDRSAFAWYGQQILGKLASLNAVSVAVIDGRCLDAGLEIALACDRRFCVSRSTTLLGFPGRTPCFGGSVRLRAVAGRRGSELLKSGRIVSGREAKQMGLVDVACSERRSKIELRTMLDRLEARPLKARYKTEAEGLAEERRSFSSASITALCERPLAIGNSAPPFPAMLGLLGIDATIEKLAAVAVLHGASVVVSGDRSRIYSQIVESRARGFITPLEAEQARLRVRVSDSLDGFGDAELVFVAAGHNPFRLAAAIRPRTIVCVIRPAGGDPPTSQSHLAVPFPFPRRLVHLSFCGSERVALFPDAATDPETLTAVSAWMKPFGYTSVVFPVAARLLPRAA
jgi:enoyl-CoA hydratase/carnithine racemase